MDVGGGPLNLAGRQPQLVDLRYRAHHRAVGAGVGPERLVGEVAALPVPGVLSLISLTTVLREKAIGEIERFSLANETTPLVITFAEGDSYVCHCDTGEWEDNGEWSSGEDARNLPGYEEWYEIGLLVIKTIVPGPNKDPRYRYIDISRKHMPCRVTAGDTVLYEE